METIADRIRYRRIELNLTQDELAKKLGYKHKTSITKIETGKQMLTQSKIAAISKALQTTPKWILGWEDELLEQPEKEKLTVGYDELSADGKKMLMNYLTYLLQSEHLSQPQDG